MRKNCEMNSRALASLPPSCRFAVLPRREVVPARAAGRLRVWRDDRNARLHQVAPVLDPLWIAFAHQEDDRGGVGRAVLRQAFLPSLVDQAALLHRIDVVRERERDHVGFEAVDDGPRLSAGAAVGLLDGHLLVRLGLPELDEGGVEVCVQLTRRVVRHVEQRLRERRSRKCQHQRTHSRKTCQDSHRDLSTPIFRSARAPTIRDPFRS